MASFLIYIHVAFGAFMSYIFTPALTREDRARLILEHLLSDDRKERLKEGILLVLIVVAGSYLAFRVFEPSNYRLAISAGLGWTSAASVARTTVGLARSRPSLAGSKQDLARSKAN